MFVNLLLFILAVLFKTNDLDCKTDFIIKIAEIKKIDFNKSIIYLSDSGLNRLNLVDASHIKKIKIQDLELEFLGVQSSYSYYPTEPVIILWGNKLLHNTNEVHFSVSHLNDKDRVLNTFIKWYNLHLDVTKSVTGHLQSSPPTGKR